MFDIYVGKPSVFRSRKSTIWYIRLTVWSDGSSYDLSVGGSVLVGGVGCFCRPLAAGCHKFVGGVVGEYRIPDRRPY